MAALELSSSRRRSLCATAHALKPVVLVGQAGVTEGLVREIDLALTAHELIKVQMRKPEEKKAMAKALAAATGAALCGLVGHVLILYRPRPEESDVPAPAATTRPGRPARDARGRPKPR